MVLILPSRFLKPSIFAGEVEDLALEVIAEAIRRVPAKKYIAFCEAVTRGSRTKKAGKGASAGKPAKSPRRSKSKRS
jgi:hypothetical protein